MGEVEALHVEHRQIATMAAELAAIAAAAAPPDPLVFLQFRREFGRILTRHLRREEWAVYPRLVGHRDPRVRALAATLCAESEGFSAEFAAYAGRWTSSQISVEWEAFRGETLAMIARLHARIEVEETRLYPLLAEAAAISRPRAMRRFA